MQENISGNNGNRNPATPSPELLEVILNIIREKGLKATTMELVARNLRISKRTLYEIFESKTDMIIKVFSHNSERMFQKALMIFQESPNVMIAMMRIFDFHRDALNHTSIQLFRDMDRLYPELRRIHQERYAESRKNSLKIFELGVEQGVFRNDVNFPIMLRMLECQSEAAKRAEELFPPEVTLLEIYDTMTTSFLRSIASEKGNRLLDEIKKSNQTEINQPNKHINP